MDIIPDFRTRLQESRREGQRRTFRRIVAGSYRLSVQASGEHHCEPRRIVPAEDYERWEVAVFTADGAWATPETHPEVFLDTLWTQYWVPSDTGDTATGQYVPTEVVQTLYDFLVLGPDAYHEVSSGEP
jgi:hypothetical protein